MSLNKYLSLGTLVSCNESYQPVLILHYSSLHLILPAAKLNHCGLYNADTQSAEYYPMNAIHATVKETGVT